MLSFSSLFPDFFFSRFTHPTHNTAEKYTSLMWFAGLPSKQNWFIIWSAAGFPVCPDEKCPQKKP